MRRPEPSGRWASVPTAGFFAWQTDPRGEVIDEAVAPDGDQWIAAALWFASGRWGDGDGIQDYAGEARALLHAMWHQHETGGVDMFDATTHLRVFSPPRATGFSDPSYALPAFYRVFAWAVPEDADLWDAAYDAGQKLLQAAYDPATGLAPCYSTFDGRPTLRPGETPSDDAYGRTFQEDAWRAVANANVDAAWFGVQDWQARHYDGLLHLLGFLSASGQFRDWSPGGVTAS